MTPFNCPSTDGPGPCHNHTEHVAPRGCVHHGSYVPDHHDTTEARDDDA